MEPVDPRDVDLVGVDPDSGEQECPAVWREPGGLFLRGKTVTDPELTSRFGDDVIKGEDETDVWVPDRLFPAIREAVDDNHEQRRKGRGQEDFRTLVERTEHSLIRFETRDAYDAGEASGFERWRKDGDLSEHKWSAFPDIVRAAVARGVRWRRVRIISRPPSEYIRWEHAITDGNVEFGEDIRWLWRDEAADLLVPAADCWVSDNLVIRWNFLRGDDSNPHVFTFRSDPRIARDIAGAFEAAWNRATPHTEFDIDSDISAV